MSQWVQSTAMRPDPPDSGSVDDEIAAFDGFAHFGLFAEAPALPRRRRRSPETDKFRRHRDGVKAGAVAGTMEKLPAIIDTPIGAVRACKLHPMLEQA